MKILKVINDTELVVKLEPHDYERPKELVLKMTMDTSTSSKCLI